MISAPAINAVLHPSPFRLEARPHTARAGQTIAEILADIPDLPPEIWTHGLVKLGEWEIPRENWHLVRPKAGTRAMMHIGVAVGGSKTIWGTIASIALVVATIAISGGLLAPVASAAGLWSGAFAAGSISASLAAAGVAIVGTLAINALTAPPTSAATTKDSSTSNSGNLGMASIGGNQLGQFEPIPFVIGTHKVQPPHLVPPFAEYENDDMWINAIVGLNNAHAISDIRINNAAIATYPDVEYETRICDATPLTLIDRQVYEQQIGSELQPHRVCDDSGTTLQDGVNSYPQWQACRSRNSPFEIWLTFVWSNLLNQTDTGTTDAGTAIRLRIRKLGDSTWINLPEFHAQRQLSSSFRGMIKLRFQAAQSDIIRIDADRTKPPWVFALYVTNSDNSESFDVDSYFTASSGNYASKVGSENGVGVIWLDPATFTPGYYEIQAIRGYGYEVASFDETTYKYTSATPYFFTSSPGFTLLKDQSKVFAHISLASISSAWNEYPIQGQENLTLLAIRAKNVAISQVSCLAQGYANTWSGSNWSTLALTNNPAAWWRWLALGNQSIRPPFQISQLDDASLEDWYTYCATNSLQCNAYVSGTQTIGDVLKMVASCGHASSRISDKTGVVIDNDRTAESPIALLSQRNSSGLSIQRAFPLVPDSLRLKFNDRDNDYLPTEIFVYRKPIGATTTESMDYVGITSEAEARARASLDYKQLVRRPALYSLTTDIQNLYCTKGSLVVLAHDTISRHYDSARISAAALSGGSLSGLTLDSALRLSLVNPTPAGVVVQFKDGSTLTLQLNETTDTNTVTLASTHALPTYLNYRGNWATSTAYAVNDVTVDGGLAYSCIAAHTSGAASEPGAGASWLSYWEPLLKDCLVASGPFSTIEKRMIVLSIKPQDQFTAALTLIDEAPPVSIVSPGGVAIVHGSDAIMAPF